MPSHAPREISYAHSAKSKAGRALIRVLENTTGRIRMIKRAEGYEQEVAAGADFWEVMTERYGVSLEILGGSLDDIPRDGPLTMIANHPYGILDGLMMGHMLSHSRGDFRILANAAGMADIHGQAGVQIAGQCGACVLRWRQFAAVPTG